MPLGLNLSPVQFSSAKAKSPRAIVAFGDSLTAGAGASSERHRYPAVAAALFDPPRDIVNKGVGGQTSTQIATRQGGLPLLVAVQGDRPRNLFPHTRDWMDFFEPGAVNGLTHELAHMGVDENGLPYGDVRIHGTAVASFTDLGRQIYGSLAANYTVETGSAWTITGDVQVVGGDTNGITGFDLLLIQSDEPGGYLNEIASPGFPLTSMRSKLSGTGVAMHPHIRSTYLLNVTNGAEIDVTIRIFPGQFEAGDAATTLQLTPGDSVIPAYDPDFSITYSFETGEEGWSRRSQDSHITPVSAESGKLVVQNDDSGILRGCEIALASIPNGKTIRVGFDLEYLDGFGNINVGGVQAPGGSWATATSEGNPTWTIAASGHHELIFISGNAEFGNTGCGAITFVNSGDAVTWSLDDIVIEWADETPQIPVTYKSSNILYGSGAYSGSMPGKLAGISGVITTDANGNWMFTRRTAGDGADVPHAAPFMSDDAALLRRRIQWIWAGRNNAADRAAVLADIEAMAAHTAGGRYLIGSLLPAADDAPDLIDGIRDINTELAAIYGPRYVDLYGSLIASGDGSPGDTGDIEAGRIPRSLRFDTIHLNDQGYAVVASAWKNATTAMRW